jgi:tRNA(Ile)-lysidine synthase
MTGTKKLKDYLSDRKVEAINRDKLLLLAHGNRIYWVQGVGISQEVRVDEATTQIVEIRLLPKDR